MKIFAFGHKRYVGKDTAGRFLTSHIRINHGGLQVQKLAFADKLKEICYLLFKPYGLKPAAFYETNPSEKETVIPEIGLSARDIWIRFGNDVRAYHKDTWIDFALDQVFAPVILVTDLRYQNEAIKIKERGGILIRIDRPDIEQFNDPADNNLNGFASWDYIITNDSLDNLYKQVTEIVDKEMKR